MKKMILGGALVTALVLSTAAFANKTDANGDGYFSRDEQVSASFARYEKKFNAADVNHDGKVTLDEISGKKLTVAKSADLNKDGVITREEAKAHVEKSIDKKIAKKDLDHDGKLSKEERQRKKTS